MENNLLSHYTVGTECRPKLETDYYNNQSVIRYDISSVTSKYSYQDRKITPVFKGFWSLQVVGYYLLSSIIIVIIIIIIVIIFYHYYHLASNQNGYSCLSYCFTQDDNVARGSNQLFNLFYCCCCFVDHDPSRIENSLTLICYILVTLIRIYKLISCHLTYLSKNKLIVHKVLQRDALKVDLISILIRYWFHFS